PVRVRRRAGGAERPRPARREPSSAQAPPPVGALGAVRAVLPDARRLRGRAVRLRDPPARLRHLAGGVHRRAGARRDGPARGVVAGPLHAAATDVAGLRLRLGSDRLGAADPVLRHLRRRLDLPEDETQLIDTFLGAVVQAPVVEEAMKSAGLLGLLIWGRRYISGPLDGVVYAALIAGGFAFTENILY